MVVCKGIYPYLDYVFNKIVTNGNFTSIIDAHICIGAIEGNIFIGC